MTKCVEFKEKKNTQYSYIQYMLSVMYLHIVELSDCKNTHLCEGM